MATRNRNDVGPVRQVPWTPDLVLRAARVDSGLPRADQVAQIEAARAAGGLSAEAIGVLRKAGWRELRA